MAGLTDEEIFGGSASSSTGFSDEDIFGTAPAYSPDELLQMQAEGVISPPMPVPARLDPSTQVPQLESLDKPSFFDHLLSSFSGANMGIHGPQAVIDSEYSDYTADLPVLNVNKERYDELPELSHTAAGPSGDASEWKEVGMDMLAGVARTFMYEEDYALLMNQLTPNSKLYRTPEGELVLDVDGNGQTLQAVNADGPSGTDALQITGDFVGTATTGRGIHRGANRISRKAANKFGNAADTVVGQGLGGLGYSAGKDIVGNSLTGQTPFMIDSGRALGEGIGAGVGTSLFKGIGKLKGGWAGRTGAKDTNLAAAREIENADGNLADTARTALEEAGFDLNAIDPAFYGDINNALLEFPNLDGAQLGRAIYMKGREGVDPTSAYTFRSQDAINQQNTLGGAPAPGQVQAENPIKERIQDTRQRLDYRTQDAQVLPQDAAGDIQGTLAGQRQTEYDRFNAPDQGFKKLRSDSTEMGMPDAEEFHTGLKEAIISGVRESNNPAAAKDLIESSRFDDMLDVENPANMGEYLDFISGLKKKGQEGNQAAAKAIDYIQSTIEDAALNGNDGLVRQYRELLSEYKVFSENWSPDRLVSKVTEVGADGTTLAVEPHMVVQSLLGTRNSGSFLNNNGVQRALKDLKTRLPDTQWKQIQQEMMYRLIGKNKMSPNMADPAEFDNATKGMWDNFQKAKDEWGDEALENMFEGYDGKSGKEVLADTENYLRAFTLTEGKSGGDFINSGTMPSYGVRDKLKKGPLVGGFLEESRERAMTRDVLDPNRAARGSRHTSGAPGVAGYLLSSQFYGPDVVDPNDQEWGGMTFEDYLLKR